MRPRLLGLPGEVDGVGGHVGANPGHDLGPITDSLDYDPDQALLFLVGGRGRLTRGAVNDEALTVHLVHQVGGEPGGTVVVDGTVRAMGVIIAVIARPKGAVVVIQESYRPSAPAS